MSDQIPIVRRPPDGQSIDDILGRRPERLASAIEHQLLAEILIELRAIRKLLTARIA